MSPLGWTGLTAQGVSMGGLLSSAPLGIASTRARSRFGPGNEKHLQEMLSFPPAALEVHRVLQFTLVDFGAVCAGQLGKTASYEAGRRADGHTQLLPSAL